MKIITLEGIDCIGKSTQCHLLSVVLNRHKRKSIYLRTDYIGSYRCGPTGAVPLRVDEIIATPTVKTCLWWSALLWTSERVRSLPWDFVVLDRFDLTERLYGNVIPPYVKKRIIRPHLTIIMAADVEWLKKTRPRFTTDDPGPERLSEIQVKYLKCHGKNYVHLDVTKKTREWVTDRLLKIVRKHFGW